MTCLECTKRAAAAQIEGKVGYFMCGDCCKREECGGVARAAVPTDRVRLHVTMWNMARALGLNWTTVDASRPDHELLEEIGAAVNPRLGAVFREGYDARCQREINRANACDKVIDNPYDGTFL